VGIPARVLNIYQADEIGCHITPSPGPDQEAGAEGKDLAQYSQETVEMF